MTASAEALMTEQAPPQEVPSQPLHEISDDQVQAEMVNFDQQLTDILDQGAQTAPEVHDAAPEQEQKRHQKWRSLGKAALIRAGLEVFGAGVDAGLLFGSQAGVSALGSVTSREMIATAGDVAILDKIQGSEESEAGISRKKQVGKKLGNLAIGITTAIVAQKIGVNLVDQINDGLNSGVGEYAVPIASKVGAMAGVNAVRARVGH